VFHAFLGIVAVAVLACSSGVKSKEVDSKVVSKKTDQFPWIYSYQTDSLKEKLMAKAEGSTLSLDDKKRLFESNTFDNVERTKSVLFSGTYDIVLLDTITYSNGSLSIYYFKDTSDFNPRENDFISMILYYSNNRISDVKEVHLEDAFSSKEILVRSKTEFLVRNIDSEYSPDPESEKLDKEMGYKNEPVESVLQFEIDTVKMKFIPVE